MTKQTQPSTSTALSWVYPVVLGEPAIALDDVFRDAAITHPVDTTLT